MPQITESTVAGAPAEEVWALLARALEQRFGPAQSAP